jgi:hypothetical protein
MKGGKERKTLSQCKQVSTAPQAPPQRTRTTTWCGCPYPEDARTTYQLDNMVLCTASRHICCQLDHTKGACPDPLPDLVLSTFAFHHHTITFPCCSTHTQRITHNAPHGQGRRRAGGGVRGEGRRRSGQMLWHIQTLLGRTARDGDKGGGGGREGKGPEEKR